MSRTLAQFFVLLLLPGLAVTLSAQDDEVPREMQQLRSDYDRSVERVLKPIQRKYVEVMEELRSSASAEGNLEKALQFKREVEAAAKWETIPVERFRQGDGAPLKENPKPDGRDLPEEGQRLKDSYETALYRDLKPIQDKHVADLERLLERYTIDERLDDAVRLKEEIASAKKWDTLPLAQFRSDARSDLDREGFEKWLTTKSFFFKGVNAVTLRFDDDKVIWGTGRTQQYEYRVTGRRRVSVFGAQEFKLEFSEDLSSGTFESNVGTYDLTIEER